MYPALTLYDMVDVGGLDLADIVGKTYIGLYNKLLAAMSSEYDTVLYNWYCAEILLPPADVTLEIDSDNFISINGIIFIRPNDTVFIPSMVVIPVIEQLAVTENGTYIAPSGVDGFSPVTVNVEQVQPVFETLSVIENGTYYPETGVDGFNQVTVNVSTPVITDFLCPGYDEVSSDSEFGSLVSGMGQPRAECAMGSKFKNWWGSANNSQHWIKIKLKTASVISQIRFANFWQSGSSTWYSANVKFQASNDNSTWVDLLSLTSLSESNTQRSYDLLGTTEYLYYRFLCNSTKSYYTGLGKIEFNLKLS